MDLHIRDFDRVVFFTGAGMSAESGVPTYRGPGGIWKEYDYERYACQEAFDRDPEGVWEFHNYRREVIHALKPNAGHTRIAELQRMGLDVHVVTQNIDGMHQLAGSPEVTELHGSLWRVRCQDCGFERADREAPLQELRCGCGSYLRPDIIWFGDALNPAPFREGNALAESCDLFISVGTSGAVMPAAMIPLRAKRAGATLVEVNIEDTELSHAFDHHLRGSATEMIARLSEGL